MTNEEFFTTAIAIITLYMVLIFVLILIIINQNKIIKRYKFLNEQKIFEYQRSGYNARHFCQSISEVDLLTKKINEMEIANKYPHNNSVAESIWEIAMQNNYAFLDYQENIGMVSFSRDDIRINIYLTKMTVCTILPHPKQGRNSLYRKKVDLDTMKLIFENPRVHTNKGYREKNKTA